MDIDNGGGAQKETRRRKPGMRAVAEAAGVSLKTVSRVVNRETGVTPDLREQVLAAIDQLGYSKPMRKTDELAPEGSDAPSRTVSILVDHLTFPFQAVVTSAIQRACFRRGYLTLVSATDASAEIEKALVREHLRRGVRGLIVAPTPQGADLLREISSRVPIVFFDRTVPDATADSVLVDNSGGAREAVEHLIERGHRRIAIIGADSSIETAYERHIGYKLALSAAGIEVDPRLVRLQVLGQNTVRNELDQLARLEDPPTAIFATSGSYMSAVVQQLRTSAKVALVGFDEIPFADSLRDGLTIVAQHPTAIGDVASDLLFRRIEGDETAPKRMLIGTALVVRPSSLGPIAPLRSADIR